MSFGSHSIRIAFGIADAAALLACASSAPPQALVAAEQAYSAAANDEVVSKNAPVYLYQAKQDLDRAQHNLYRLATVRRENADRQVLIEGHTDSIGGEDYNLSRRRAEAVLGFLTQNGIDGARAAVMGYGETRPVTTNETDAGRQQNRRVEIVILDPGKQAAQEIGR